MGLNIHRIVAIIMMPVAFVVACGGGSGNSSYDSNATCDDSGTKVSGNISVSNLERCIYDGNNKTLAVRLIGGKGDNLYVDVNISGFSGEGTYKTTGNEDTAVSMRAFAGPGDGDVMDFGSQGGTEAGDCPPHTCTIKVTDDSVVTADPGGKGQVTLEVSCPKLGNAGVGCVVCELAKSTFTIDVAECSHEE